MLSVRLLTPVGSAGRILRRATGMTLSRRGYRAGLLPAFALVALSVSMGACAKARAEANPAGPPLTMPAPPARVLLPPPAEPIAATPAEEPPLASVPRVTPQPLPSSRRPAAARTDPEARPETPAAVATPATGTTEPRELRPLPSRATPAADQARVEKFLKQADADRRRVDYAKLSTEGKKNYDDSRRFSEQALEKLKESNVLAAVSAAEKAATLAGSLSN